MKYLILGLILATALFATQAVSASNGCKGTPRCHVPVPTASPTPSPAPPTPSPTPYPGTLTLSPNPGTVADFHNDQLAIYITGYPLDAGDVVHISGVQDGFEYIHFDFTVPFDSSDVLYYLGTNVFDYVQGDFLITASYDGNVIASTTLTVVP